MNDTYKTSDMYLASYLMMMGKKLADIKRVSPKRSEFIFAEDCAVEQDDFYLGDAKKFLDYARAMRDLKSMMYSKMELDTSKFHSRKYEIDEGDSDMSFNIQK